MKSLLEISDVAYLRAVYISCTASQRLQYHNHLVVCYTNQLLKVLDGPVSYINSVK